MATIDRIPIYLHWSTFVVAGLMLLASFPAPAGSIVAMAAYLAILLLHEWGHVIAWGGVLAQLAVGVPLVVSGSLLGSYSPGAVTALVGVFGYISIFVAVMNLLPIPPLDGANAWPLVPMLLGRGIGAYLRRSQRPRGSRKKKWVN